MPWAIVFTEKNTIKLNFTALLSMQHPAEYRKHPLWAGLSSANTFIKDVY